MQENNVWKSFPDIEPKDFAQLKERMVSAEKYKSAAGCKKDLDEHMVMLAEELYGKPELELYNNWLIVKIRRKIDLQHHINKFKELWEHESGFLIKSLSLRWLISVCDTIVDTYEDREEVAISIMSTLFINTIKLYETEKWMYGIDDEEYKVLNDKRPDSSVPLFDGVTAFKITHGDMVYNLVERIYSQHDPSKVSWQIFMELLRRAHINPTVFKRIADAHTNPKTEWWKDDQFVTSKKKKSIKDIFRWRK